MPSWSKGSTHGWMKSGVSCHHRHKITYNVGQRHAWYVIIALGLNTHSENVENGITSLPLVSTQCWTTSGVACYHCPCAAHSIGLRQAAHMVRRRRSSHGIIALGQNTPPGDVGRCMPSLPMGSTNLQNTLGLACHHSP